MPTYESKLNTKYSLTLSPEPVKELTSKSFNAPFGCSGQYALAEAVVKESLERRADASGENTCKWADAAHLLGFVANTCMRACNSMYACMFYLPELNEVARTDLMNLSLDYDAILQKHEH